MQTSVDKFLQQYQQSLAPEITAVDQPIRVLGPFSSGKSTLIRLLIQDIVPEKLLPITSRAVQTRLPLRITYGEEIKLILRKGTKETALTAFPHRKELAHTDPFRDELTLYIPKKELLSSSESFAKEGSIAAMALLDTPGWDSDDPSHLERIGQSKEDSPGIILVAKGTTVDSKHFYEQLTKIFTQVANSIQDSDFVADHQFQIIPIINDQPGPLDDPQDISDSMKNKLKKMLKEVCEAQDLYFDELFTLHTPIWWDLHKKSPQNDQKRIQLWKRISDLFSAGNAQVKNTGQLNPQKAFVDFSLQNFKEALLFLEDMETFVSTTKNTPFFKGIKKRLFVGLNRKEVKEILMEAIDRNTGFCQFPEQLERMLAFSPKPLLPKKHGLSPLFHSFWGVHLNHLHKAFQTWYATISECARKAKNHDALEGFRERTQQKPFAALENTHRDLAIFPTQALLAELKKGSSKHKIAVNLLAMQSLKENLDNFSNQPTSL